MMHQQEKSYEVGRGEADQYPQAPQESPGAYLRMYQIPGVVAIEAEDAERYFETAHALLEDIPDIVEKGLADEGEYVRRMATKMIVHAPEGERARLIERGLADEDEYVRRTATKMIVHAPEGAQGALQKRWQSTALINNTDQLAKLAVHTPLYEQTRGRRVREQFEKTGSRTTLLDIVPGNKEATLKHRVIVRHIGMAPYLNWSRAYENHAFWKAKGFDYVPVEPIVRARKDRDPNTVAVFSRVLGPSADTWLEQTPLFAQEINKSIERIRAALSELGVEHGHAHNGNFCLVFERTSDGTVDLSRPPRVYVIDFDAAASSPKK